MDRMAEVIIFGGTTEGRELAVYAASMKIPVLLSVVSEYGKKTAGKTADFSVRCGALDEEGIFRLLQKVQPQLVLDATHPHAAAATGQIREACRRAEVRCLRVLRKEEGTEAQGEQTKCPVFRVHSAWEAAEILAGDDGPVFLTTGSKELAAFITALDDRERIFARVLPDSQILAGCEKLGLSGRQLIAMQGPFSEEMNIAMLRAVGAKWLVTKESGSQGGFWEKLRAAETCGVSTIVIQRPEKEQGISAKQAREELRRLAKDKEGRLGKSCLIKSGQQVFLIGTGMGGGSQLTQEALAALQQCEIVLGASRLLADVAKWVEGKPREILYLGEEIRSWLEGHPEFSRIAVVYSGDTGFYSGCSSLLRALAKKDENTRPGIRVRIFPGISTLSCLCSRLGKSWERIYPASIHGRDCEVEKLLLEYRSIFLLLGGKENLGSLCRRLAQSGLGDAWVSAGIQLGYPEERILTARARELCGQESDSLAAVILEHPDAFQENPEMRELINADQDFRRSGDGG